MTTSMVTMPAQSRKDQSLVFIITSTKQTVDFLTPMNGKAFQAWIGETITLLGIFFAVMCLAVACPAHAADDSALASQLANMANDKALNFASRASALKAFAAAHPGSDMGRNALLLACAYLLKTEDPAKGKESLEVLSKLMKSTKGSWQEGLTTITLLNALHVNGLSKDVYELGLHSLNNNLEGKLRMSGDQLPPQLKEAFHFDAKMYLDLAQEMVRISGKNLGYSESILSPSRSTPTTPSLTSDPPHEQIDTSVPTQKPPAIKQPPAPKAKPAPSSGEEPTSSTPWSIIVVLIVAACGLLWLLVKNRK
jgi:hypothetical protein